MGQPQDRRKQYMADVYSAFWQRQVLVYGFTDYHQGMIELVQSIRPRLAGHRLLECAIGTGWPFAVEFARRGWSVYGVDIAPTLVTKCKENERETGVELRCVEGDVEHLPYREGAFDLTYCFQSTWYFSDFERAVDEMILVTKAGGYVVFDVMNLLNPMILCSYVRLIFRRRANLDFWADVVRRRPLSKWIIHETPTSPWRVSNILRSRNVRCIITTSQTRNIACPVPSSWFDPRLVYICRKTEK